MDKAGNLKKSSSKDPRQRVKFLKLFFFSLLIINFLLVVFTPLLINRDFPFIDQERLETLMIFLLSIIGSVLYLIYEREIGKNLKKLEEFSKENKTLEERMDDAIKHIGSLNVQIQEVRSIFSDINKYPENKKDFKHVLDFLGKKILGIINTDWVLLRIINPLELQTLREYSQSRGNAILLKCQVPNEKLVNGRKVIEEFSFIESEPSNLNLRVYCIFPKIKISQEQEILIKAIANQLELIFIIFTSNYYKNSRTENGQGG